MRYFGYKCILFLVYSIFLSFSAHSQNLILFEGNVHSGDIIAARVEEKLYVRETLSEKTVLLSNGLYSVVRDSTSLFDFIVYNNNVTIEYREEKVVYRDSTNAQFYRFISNHLEKKLDLPDWWQLSYAEAVPVLRVVFPQIFEFNGATHKKVAQQYWDLNDKQFEFLKNSPFVRSYLNNFYDRMISQHYDSIFSCIESQMTFVDDEDLRTFYFSVLTNKYETSKILGHENVFASLVMGFPVTDFKWVDDSVYSKLREKAIKIRTNPVGAMAINFPLKDVKNDKLTSLKDIFGIYKLLVFFDSDCGHCKTAMPYYMEVVEEFKDNGITPIFVTVETTNEFLLKFIASMGYDASFFYYHHTINTDDFRIKYDLPSTPQIYILDSNDRILAKNIPAKEIKDYISFLIDN